MAGSPTGVERRHGAPDTRPLPHIERRATVGPKAVPAVNINAPVVPIPEKPADYSAATATIGGVTKVLREAGDAMTGKVPLPHQTASEPLPAGGVPPVRNPVASITVSPTGMTLKVGATEKLSATVKDALGNLLTDRAVVFTTDNNTLVTVDTGGVVRAAGKGSAKVTATCEAHSAVCNVTGISP